MIDNLFVCAVCSLGGMTEQQATSHECGVTAPEPEVVDEPMLMREAVLTLANQLANITAVLSTALESMEVTMTAADEKFDRAIAAFQLIGDRMENLAENYDRYEGRK